MARTRMLVTDSSEFGFGITDGLVPSHHGVYCEFAFRLQSPYLIACGAQFDCEIGMVRRSDSFARRLPASSAWRAATSTW